jgi:hypothetical protein
LLLFFKKEALPFGSYLKKEPKNFHMFGCGLTPIGQGPARAGPRSA